MDGSLGLMLAFLHRVDKLKVLDIMICCELLELDSILDTSVIHLLFSAIAIADSFAQPTEHAIPTPFQPSHPHVPNVVPGAQHNDCTSVPVHTVLTEASTALFPTSPLA